jgi:hypothetical protein
MDELIKSLQASVFNSETPQQMDVYHVFLAECSKLMRTSGMSRPLLADRMNDAIGGENVVSANKLNKWFSPGTDQFMPVHLLPAFCWAVRSIEPVNLLLQPLAFKAVDQRGQLFQQYAELQIDAADKSKAAEKMAAELIRLIRPE